MIFCISNIGLCAKIRFSPVLFCFSISVTHRDDEVNPGPNTRCATPGGAAGVRPYNFMKLVSANIYCIY